MSAPLGLAERTPVTVTMTLAQAWTLIDLISAPVSLNLDDNARNLAAARAALTTATEAACGRAPGTPCNVDTECVTCGRRFTLRVHAEHGPQCPQCVEGEADYRRHLAARREYDV